MNKKKNYYFCRNLPMFIGHINGNNFDDPNLSDVVAFVVKLSLNCSPQMA